MNWRRVKGIVFCVAAFAAALPSLAQTVTPASDGFSSMPLGSVVKGFVMPQRNETGDLQSNIMGEEARVLSPDRIAITGLKVDLYETGGTRVGTVITAPHCDFWTIERRLSGHDGVDITRSDAHITADFVDWDFKTQVALLHQNVRVVLLKVDLGSSNSAKP